MVPNQLKSTLDLQKSTESLKWSFQIKTLISVHLELFSYSLDVTTHPIQVSDVLALHGRVYSEPYYSLFFKVLKKSDR